VRLNLGQPLSCRPEAIIGSSTRSTPWRGYSMARNRVGGPVEAAEQGNPPLSFPGPSGGYPAPVDSPAPVDFGAGRNFGGRARHWREQSTGEGRRGNCGFVSVRRQWPWRQHRSYVIEMVDTPQPTSGLSTHPTRLVRPGPAWRSPCRCLRPTNARGPGRWLHPLDLVGLSTGHQSPRRARERSARPRRGRWQARHLR
jgi:hypothetical protein